MIFFLLNQTLALSQGFNHQWLQGYWPFSYQKSRMLFDSTSYTLQTEYRKMEFWGTEANICDANGNFLMSSNGIWIANANNDTMLNGAGLNPNAFTGTYPNGMEIPYANIILPYPADSSKYILFHESGTYNGLWYPIRELLFSMIDLTLDNGLGAVTLKNDTAFQDTLGWGYAACKHANGRDWWIVALKDSSDIIFKILLTPNGIANISSEHLNVTPFAWGNVTQPTFSYDGNKFTYSYSYFDTVWNNDVRLFDFDRCTGNFSNPHIINTSDGHPAFGCAFSSSSQYIYATSTAHIFQIDLNTLNVDTVALYDGFNSPYTWCCATTFLFLYPAANGKIYVTSGNGVQHIHEINYPDSAGIFCDVQQHAINLGIWNLRAVPNHPNYYLGPVSGSVCDSLGLSVQELNHNFHFNLFPNPNNGAFNISYLLPQNKEGKLQIFDVTGKYIYKYNLPQWSTEQQINLPNISEGLYNCIITSGNRRVNKKLVVIKE